jgi:hypothetical protein
METMMRRAALAALCLVTILGAAAMGAKIEEKWVYVSTNLIFEKNVDKVVGIIGQCKELGVTHIQLNDYQFGFMDALPPIYFENVKRVRKAAADAGVAIVPGIFSIGSSGRYLFHNPNLADGIPVKGMRFVVKGGVAKVDPALAPSIANAGFDDDTDATAERALSTDGQLAGWGVQETSEGGPHIFADREVKHSGASSLRFANLTDVPRRRGGRYGVMQTVDVKPFHTYRLGVWIKTDGVEPPEHPLEILGSRDKRVLCFSYFMQSPKENWARTDDSATPGVLVSSNKKDVDTVDFGIKPTQDWTLFKVAFNTLDYDEIDLSVPFSAGPGTIWFDDITLEPVGLQNVLRRDLTPLVVTSADGSVVYQECVDFKRVEDPNLGAAPSRGDFMVSSRGTFGIWHDGPPIVLTENSRIKDGDAILVSYYSPGIIYVKQQVTVSLSEPAVFDVMEDEMKRVSDAWQATGYFMNYDEIRSAGWEMQPGGAALTPGQILANHIKRAVEIAHKYAPEAKLYTWSDMFDPNHNAREMSEGRYYYYVNGSYAGSWEGLPKEVIIVNWNGRGGESLKWFAGRGHEQVIAGYYDADTSESVRRGIDRWLLSAEGVPGVIGYMYTTWDSKYTWMSEFFKYLDEWDPAKAAAMPSAGGGGRRGPGAGAEPPR